MALLLTQGPLVEPVSLSEVKEMLRIDQGDTSQDNLLLSLNTAARAYCETLTQRRFVQQTWALYLDFFPGYIDLKLAGQRVSTPFVSGSNAVLVGIRYAVALPYPPVQQFESFTYINSNAVITDMMNGSTNPANWNFVLDIASAPARVCPLFGQMWPVAMVIPNALKLEYTVGYASPITVTTVHGSPVLGVGTFTAANVGQPISIPGAGLYGGCLNTVIQSVTSGVATIRDSVQGPASSVTALLVNNGIAAHWELIKNAIKTLTNQWHVRRMPSFDADTRNCIRALLMPVSDLRL